MVFGQLNEDRDLVINVIELREEQADEFPDCVSSRGLPIAIGDEYRDGDFYRNGEIVKED